MENNLEKIKTIVRRFNKEVIEQGNTESFEALMDKDFINHSAPESTNNGPEGMIYTFNNILRPAISNIQVIIYDQLAEGDVVTTRKVITGTHTGVFFGIEPSGKSISIDVIDIVRIRNGKYFEHWGINTLPTVLSLLEKK